MMIEHIIRWSVQKRWVILFLTAVATVWGTWSFISLPIDAVPDITNVQVQVNATSEGLTPEDLESKVTFPIEIAMGGIPGVQEVRSLTKLGLSQVTVVFDDSSDLYRNRQLVTEKLQSLPELPPGVKPPALSPITTGLGEIYHYTVEVQDEQDPVRALMKAREIHEWVIRPRLLSVAGVAEVNTIGGHSRQLQIQPNLAKLASYRLNLSDLRETLEQANRNVGGNYILEGEKQILLQASGQFQTVEDVKRVPIKSLQNFSTITVGDLADVKFAGGTRTGAALVNGKEAVLGTVMMLSGANSRTVAKAVATRVNEIKNELPQNTKIHSLYDRSELVDSTLNTVLHNLVVGAALVVIVLFILLGNIKAALIVSISIPVTLIITFGFMKLLGISGNLMSLGALDFGIIVDGAVIVVDHCVRWIQDKTKSISVLEKITRASQEIRSAAGFGQLMIIAVFIPILALGGVEGKMFRPMAETFAIALGVSLVLSFTLIPALAGIFFGEKEADHPPKIMTWLEHTYVSLLNAAFQRKTVLLTGSVILIASSFILLRSLGAEFLPRLDEGSLVLQMVRSVDVSLEASIQRQEKADHLIRSFGPVASVFSRIGTGDIATDPMGPQESDTFITLKDKSAWVHEGHTFSSKDALTEELIQRLAHLLPDQETSASQPIQMRFNDLLEGTRADLTVKAYGDDLHELKKITSTIAETVKKIPGSGDVLMELRGEIPLLQIQPKYETLSRYSLPATPILDAISIGMSGNPISYFYEGLRRIPLVVKLNEKDRNNPIALKQLQIYAGNNLTLPIEEVATFNRKLVVSPIFRESSKRRSAVLINPRGRDVESLVNEAQAKISETLKIPSGYRIEWFGSFKNLQEAKSRLFVLAPFALLLVAGMIYFAFQSWIETLAVLGSVPFALVGGVIGLAITRLPFSISAAIGFIALSGIAVLNGVVLMHYWNLLRQSENNPYSSTRGWLILGAQLRLRPVLMTALVDIFGFIPMAISSGVGSEVQRPLATVVIGGVITSTLLTLVILPLICLPLFNKKGSIKR